MTKSLFGGSAAIATALIIASTFFYTTPLAAHTALASHAPVSQEKQEPAQEQKAVQPLPAPLPETALASVEVGIAPVPNSAPAAVPVVVDVAPPPAMPEAAKPVEAVEEAFAAPPQSYVATAYSLPGRTASGRPVGKGVIAADPRVLPFGTRVRIEAGPYSGEYVVADAGSGVKGRKIDVWVSTHREACHFGRRNIKLTVLSYGAKKKAKARR
jgi:3D (Asp-Asp-Asp) domain-containing protein